MKTEDKNSKLVELVAQLRDHIDLHRIIGLNRRALEESEIGGDLRISFQMKPFFQPAIQFEAIAGYAAT